MKLFSFVVNNGCCVENMHRGSCGCRRVRPACVPVSLPLLLGEEKPLTLLFPTTPFLTTVHISSLGFNLFLDWTLVNPRLDTAVFLVIPLLIELLNA